MRPHRVWIRRSLSVDALQQEFETYLALIESSGAELVSIDLKTASRGDTTPYLIAFVVYRNADPITLPEDEDTESKSVTVGPDIWSA